jgi:hypothetical protein
MFVCSQKLADDLQARAVQENRSRSNLIETLLTEVMYPQQNSSQIKEESSQLQAFLKLLTSDKPPTDPDLIELAHDLELDVKLLINLRDRLFPTRPKQPNGHK